MWKLLIVTVMLGIALCSVAALSQEERQAELIILCGQSRHGESGRYLACTLYNPIDQPKTFGWWNQRDYSFVTIKSETGVTWRQNPKEWTKHTIGTHTLTKGESKTFLIDLSDGKFSKEFEKETFVVSYSYPKEMGYDVRKKQGWVLDLVSKPFQIKRWRVGYGQPAKGKT